MDKKELQQKIAEYFVKLPKEAQDYFSSMNWMEILKNIELNFNLNEEQVETLGTETTLVLLGIIHVEEYREVIESEMDLEKEVADKLFGQINDNILRLVKEKLIESFETNALDLAEEKYGGDKKLDERFNNLPKEVQSAIKESGYQVNLYSIADKYRLDIEQMGILEEITTKVMLGIIHPDKYEEELVYKIKIPREDILNLVKEINENIFKNIREILKKHWDDNSNQKQIPDINKNTETKIPEIKDDVPVPPYAGTIKNEKLGIKNEEKTPNTTEKPIITNKPTTQPVNQPINDNSQNIMNIVEEKLRNATVSDHTISDHSNSSAKSADPYREII